MNHLPPVLPAEFGGADDGASGAWMALSAKIVLYARVRFGSCSFPPGAEFDEFVNHLLVKVMISIQSFEGSGEDSFWRWVQTIGGNLWRDQWRRYERDHKQGFVESGGQPDPLDEEGLPWHSPKSGG